MSDFFGVSQGQYAALNISSATTVKAVRGRAQRVNVLVAGTTAGAVYDSASAAADAITDQVGAIPNALGSYLIDMPCLQGITVAPGAGQTVAISYD